MSAVIVEQSVSLDGFSAGANDSPGNGLGDNGERLHDWIFANAAPESSGIMEAFWPRAGAVILGRRMFDNGFEPWDRKNPWGRPAFVLTHDAREPLAEDDDPGFTFVTDGIERALDFARAAAGDKVVAIAGGANTTQQYLRAGLVDGLNLHVVPVLLGDGVRFIEQMGDAQVRFEAAGAPETPGVAHLRYRVTAGQ